MSHVNVRGGVPTYMYAAICTARVDVLLASGLRGTEVAPYECTKYLVAAILHDATVLRVRFESRIRIRCTTKDEELSTAPRGRFVTVSTHR